MRRGLRAAPPSPQARPHFWDRWGWVWHGTFYALLAIATGAALLAGSIHGSALAMVGLSALFAAWYTLTILFLDSRWPRLPMREVYLVGASALWFVLCGYHSAYYMVLFSLFGSVYGLLRLSRAIPGAIVLTALILLRQNLTEGATPVPLPWQVAIGGLSVGFSILFGFFIDGIIRQSQERQQLIEELKATRATLAAAERQAGVLEERQRLAREIHDTLAQGFTSIVLHLEAADQALLEQQQGVRVHIEQARRTARESLAEARRLVQALRPEPLEGSSLPEALARVTRRWSEGSGIAAALVTTGTPSSLPPDVEVTLLRALQEALGNVRKHARAGRVSVTLSYMPDLVSLDVHDDGVGMPAQGTGRDEDEGGYGLRGMRERAAQLGGAVFVESAPGAGTTLVVRIPLADGVP